VALRLKHVRMYTIRASSSIRAIRAPRFGVIDGIFSVFDLRFVCLSRQSLRRESLSRPRKRLTFRRKYANFNPLQHERGPPGIDVLDGILSA
jgi:hypothetical protein